MKTQQDRVGSQMGSSKEFLQTTLQNSFSMLSSQPSKIPISQAILNLSQCIKGQKGLFFCCSATCQKSAILCGTNECQCKIHHKKCFNYFQTDNFYQHALRKQSKQKLLIIQIEKYFDKLIDQISDLRQKVSDQVKYMLWENDESSILRQFINEKITNIKGQSLQLVLDKLKNVQNVQVKQNSKIIQIMKYLQSMGQKMTHTLSDFNSSISKYNHIKVLIHSQEINQLVKQRKSGQEYFVQNTWNSQILSNIEQIQILNGFMPRAPIKKLKLLYRASQNEFYTKLFYDKCKGIPNTLIIALTQQKKIIGGFTPIPWRKYDQKYQQADPSRQTFIFSLTNKDKFTIKKSQWATHYWGDQTKGGPMFGELKYADLAIHQKANETGNNWVFGGMNFTNSKYKLKDKESNKMFTGEQDHKFKINQWEVFEVTF